jgi:hypothetical protein
MNRRSIRVASAIAGALVLFAGLFVIGRDFRGGAVLLIGGIALFAPLCMPAIDAPAANRLRIAAMICFTFAGLAWMTTISMHNHDTANSIAALGVAWWVAGFVVTPIAAYYHSRLAVVADE